MESTTNSGPAPKFDKATASSYNERWSKVASLKDALHLCMRFVLADLPSDARVLCVGVGTGAELFYLAEAFPRWKFTAVEPSSKMLDICRARADEQGLSTRCEFHEGAMDLNQFETAHQIVELGNGDALAALEGWLHHEDRHIRGNAAYVFGTRREGPVGAGQDSRSWW